jgi:hypothetical protein
MFVDANIGTTHARSGRLQCRRDPQLQITHYFSNIILKSISMKKYGCEKGTIVKSAGYSIINIVFE